MQISKLKTQEKDLNQLASEPLITFYQKMNGKKKIKNVSYNITSNYTHT